jgi:uncharacterized protein (DUF433 family)
LLRPLLANFYRDVSGSQVRGLRITVYEVLEYLASEMTEAEILDDFPDLTREDLKACIAYAADRERRFMTSPLSA